MPQYAQFNPDVAAPSPVIGWYDTDEFTYQNMPAASDLLLLTSSEWAERISNPSGWAVSNGALVAYAPTISAAQTFSALQSQASALLAASDRTIIRCYENGVVVPSAWAMYRTELRAIASGTNANATELPVRPTYPAGT